MCFPNTEMCFPNTAVEELWERLAFTNKTLMSEIFANRSIREIFYISQECTFANSLKLVF